MAGPTTPVLQPGFQFMQPILVPSVSREHTSKLETFQTSFENLANELEPVVDDVNACLCSRGLIRPETARARDITATLKEVELAIRVSEGAFDSFMQAVSEYTSLELGTVLVQKIVDLGVEIRTQLPKERLKASHSRIMFHGLPGVGKTSLCEALMKQPASFSSSESTVLANITPVCCKLEGDYQSPWLEITREQQDDTSGSEVLLHLWDCGGQQLFFDILPSFLNQNTLFLLIFDASKFEKEFFVVPSEVNNRGIQDESVLSFIQRWMALINARFGDQILCRVVLVGTHADKLHGQEKARQILEKIYLSIARTEYSTMVTNGLVVNTTLRGEDEDKGLSKLRETIIHFTELNEIQVPEVWGKFWKSLLQLKEKRPVIPLSEVNEVAAKCSVPLENIEGALFFYTDATVLLFYPTVIGLENVVFVDPQWVVDCFKELFYKSVKNPDPDLNAFQTLLIRYGILVEPFYQKVLKHVEEHSVTPQALVELLCDFKLAASVTTTGVHRWSGTVKEYFIPLMLEQTTNERYPHLQSKAIIRASPLHLVFRNSRVPPGYFIRLANCLACSYKVCFDSFLNRSCVSFKIESTEDILTIREHTETIEICFMRLAVDDELFRVRCLQLADFISKNCIAKLRRWFPAAYVRLTFSCPDCKKPAYSLSHNPRCGIHVWKVVRKYYWCRNDHYFLLTHGHRMWINPHPQDLWAIQMEHCGARLSPDEAHHFVDKLSSLEMSAVLKELEMTNAHSQDFNTLPKSISKDAFHQWVKNSGDRIELAEALRAIEMDQYATELMSGRMASLDKATSSKIKDGLCLGQDKISSDKYKQQNTDTGSENTEKYGEEEKKMTENIYNSNISNISSEQSKVLMLQQEVSMLKDKVNSLQLQLQPTRESVVHSAVQTDTLPKNSLGVQVSYLVPTSDRLRGVNVIGEKLFEVSGLSPQLLEWEKFGFRIQVPGDAVSGPCSIAVRAIVYGQFENPEGMELVSALYAISVSRRLSNSIRIEIEHCVKLENEDDCEYLSFGIAKCNQVVLPYTFEMLEDGHFYPHSKFGFTYRSSFSIIGIFKRLINFADTPSSHSEADDTEPEVMSTEQEPMSAETENSLTGNDNVEVTSMRTHGNAEQLSHEELDSVSSDSATVKTSDLLLAKEAKCPVNQYIAQLFLECQGARNFSWKFAAVKHLKALNTFLNESHHNWQKKSQFTFEFKGSCLRLQLSDVCEDSGWRICPEVYPCEIRQSDVDQFLKGSSPLPCCEVTIVANADAAEFLNYPVKVGNIQPEKTVCIQCVLGLASQLSTALDAGQETGHSRSVAQAEVLQLIHAAPEIPDLLNEVASKAVSKWKMVGLQLSIELQKLHSIENENRDSTLCYAAVFEIWKRTGKPPYTWATIIKVLKAPAVGEMQLALELEELHK